MSYSTVVTVATGDTWTASNHNIYVRDNFAATFVGLTTDQGDMAYSTTAHAVTVLSIGNANDGLYVNAGATAPNWISGCCLGFISSTNVLAGDTDVYSLVEFDNIPQVYNELILIGSAKTNAGDSSTSENLRCRFNDTTAADDHAWQIFFATGSTGEAVEGVTNEESAVIAQMGPADAKSSTFMLSIPNYASTDRHVYTSQYEKGADPSTDLLRRGMAGGIFDVQAPITKISLFPETNNFWEPFTFSLYGVR